MRASLRRSTLVAGGSLLALAVAACGRGGADLASLVDSAVVGSAQAAPAAKLWKERGPSDPLPPGVTPQPSLAPLVKLVKPTVVNIQTNTVIRRAHGTPQGPGMQGMEDPFQDFFRRFYPDVPEQRRQGLGSGFIISDQGHVITNNHVVEGATEIKVRLADEREFAARVVGRDPKTDVAVLQLNAEPAVAKALPAVFFGDSDALEVGDMVLAAGNPFGLDHSVSQGIVSAKERRINAGPYDDFIQTDAAINPGNSGGPLFNTLGEVIGVNTAIVAQGQGIGFAVPINMVKELLPQLMEKGRVVRGWLGVSIQDLTPDLARSLGVDKTSGALVAQVYRKGPAAKAGMQEGDVIVGVNGRKVDEYGQLLRQIALLVPGSKAKLEVLRDGRSKGFEVLIGERPEDERQAVLARGEAGPDKASSERLGITVAPLQSARARQLGIEGGVVIANVDPDGPAARAGARPGDVVVEAQRRPVRSVQDFSAALGKVRSGEMALLRLQREDASTYIAVKVP